MKASNPKVMIEAYRLAVARMEQEGMNYPLHLGVTEAGDGEDARVKSAIGIGSLLYDGLGDTIRVSLTEDPVHEVPVAQDLAAKGDGSLEAAQEANPISEPLPKTYRPLRFRRRRGPRDRARAGLHRIGGETVPAVIVKTQHPLSDSAAIIRDVCATQTRFKDAKIEGLQVEVDSVAALEAFSGLHEALHSVVACFVLELRGIDLSELEAYDWPEGLAGITLLQAVDREDAFYAANLLQFCRDKGFNLALDTTPEALREEIGGQLAHMGSARLILCFSDSRPALGDGPHPLGRYRALAEAARTACPTRRSGSATTPRPASQPRTITVTGCSKAASSAARCSAMASATASASRRAAA